MELIAAQFMPWRSATHLARLWSAHLKAKDPASAGAAATPVQEGMYLDYCLSCIHP